MNERRQLLLQIGGLNIQLAARGLAPTAWARLVADYNLFLRPPAGAGAHPCGAAHESVDLAIDAHTAAGPPFLEPSAAPSWRIDTHQQGSRVQYVSYFERGWIDTAARRAAVVLRPQAQLENFLRAACAWLALAHGGLLLHACGIVRDGCGYVFFGHSGAGKSTTAELSPDTLVLSDDLVWLRLRHSRAWLYGVPFRGEALDAPRANACVPLKGIYALQQARTHRLLPLPLLLGATRLLACAPFVASSAQSAARTLEVCIALAEAQPVSILEFARNPGFWPLVIDSQSKRG